ncbi:MAG: MFS transporter [Bacillota bacterium]|nr:MFS transporter [Bacillota bacterium]
MFYSSQFFFDKGQVAMIISPFKKKFRVESRDADSKQVLPHHLKTVILFGGIYSIAMQMAILLVPLYAIKLNFPPLSLALLVSLPAILQIIIRMLGGAITNYLGEKKILKISFLCITIAGLVFIVSDSLLYLYLAQLLLSTSRGLFWSTAQTYLSKLPESEGRLNKIFGMFEGITAVGAILGLILAGYFSEWFGISRAFISLIIIGVISYFLTNALPDLPRTEQSKSLSVGLKSLKQVAGHRPIYLACLCAFTAALPLSLVGSFYPVYLNSLGIQEGMIGVIISVKAAGTVTAGFLVARFLDRGRSNLPYMISFILIGSTLILTQMFSSPVILAAIIIFTGLGSGLSSILYQSLTTKFSTVENRGAAMAFTTNFWSLSHLTVPVIFGVITEQMGISFSFVISGISILILGLLGTLLFRWFTGSEA